MRNIEILLGFFLKRVLHWIFNINISRDKPKILMRHQRLHLRVLKFLLWTIIFHDLVIGPFLNVFWKGPFYFKFSQFSSRLRSKGKMLDKQALQIYYHIMGMYDVFLALFGTLGNILVFIIAFRLRKTTTFVFLIYLAVADSITLYWWNLDDFRFIYFGSSAQEGSVYGCKILNYFQLTSMESSAWLLISLSIDRFLSVWLKSWKTKHFKSKQAFIASTCIVSFYALINFHIWFTYGYREYDQNGTYVDYCHSEVVPTFQIMLKWDLVCILIC